MAAITNRQPIIANKANKNDIYVSGSPSGHAMVTAAAWWVMVSSLGSFLYLRTQRCAHRTQHICRFVFKIVELKIPENSRSLFLVSPSIRLQCGVVSCSLPAVCWHAGGCWTLPDLHPRTLSSPGHCRVLSRSQLCYITQTHPHMW